MSHLYPVPSVPWSARLLLPLLVAFMSPSLSAAEIPTGGTTLLGPEAWLTAGLRAEADAASLATVVVEGQPFDRALRVSTTRRPANPWNIKLDAPTTGSVARGDVILIAFWMRTIASEDESGDGVVNAKLQMNEPPHNGVGGQAQAGAEWRHCLLPRIARVDLPAGSHHFELHLGYWPQTVEIAGLQVINYGDKRTIGELPFMKTTYAGREPDAAWRAGAAERIAEHRMGDLIVRVRDADGQAIPDAEVQVRMRRHAFGFGSVIALQQTVDQGLDGKRYREIFAEYFNRAPTESGFRWPTWERQTPEWRAAWLDRLDRTLAFLEEHDIEARGHYLMWAPIQERNKPLELIDQPERLLAAKWDHAKTMIDWAGTRISEWDAVNHIAGWGTTFADVCAGGNQVYADMIRKGREWAPYAEMWVNEGQVLVGDGGRLAEYQQIIADLIERDAKPDGIGFMAHFRDSNLPSPSEVWRRLEEFAPFGCQLQLTELDVGGGGDEKLHADYLRDIMTIAFSHPQMDGIVLWGFWEGRHWRPSAALWRKDWSIKPAGQAWIDLVRGAWWTEEDGATDATGAFSCRGFLGTYAVTATRDGRSVTETVQLGRAGTTVTLILDEAP